MFIPRAVGPGEEITLAFPIVAPDSDTSGSQSFGLVAENATWLTGPAASVDYRVKPFLGIATSPTGGYWTAAPDGGVFAYEGAQFYGSMGGLPLAAPVSGIAATPSGRGYWLTARDGGVFAFGDAQFHGAMAGHPLNAPVVGIASTPTGAGYWLVGADGGVFAYGDAQYAGGMALLPLNAPIVGIASTPTGNGYWLVAADGGIFNYGNAPFRGSAGSDDLNAPVSGIARSPSGDGYWLVAQDGGVFAYGAPFHGSLGEGGSPQRVLGIAGMSNGGYMVLASGGVVTKYNPAPPPPPPGSVPGLMGAGETLGVGQSLTSPNGVYTLVMQSDGNLVDYVLPRPLWDSATPGHPGTVLEMQPDGNLVLYAPGHVAIWSTNTAGHPGAYLQVQDDSNLVVFSSSRVVLWAANAIDSQLDPGRRMVTGNFVQSPNRRYLLVMQGDGNLVEYDTSNWAAQWSSSTGGNPGAFVDMQSDGNLVVYGAGPLWSSGTSGRPGTVLQVQDDGNVVLYAPGHVAIWSTR